MTTSKSGDLYECQLCGVVADGAGIGLHLYRVHDILLDEETIAGAPCARLNEEDVSIAWRTLPGSFSRMSRVVSETARSKRRR